MELVGEETNGRQLKGEAEVALLLVPMIVVFEY